MLETETITQLGVYLVIEEKHVKIQKNRTIFKNEKTGKVFREEIKFDPDTGDPISKIKEEYTDWIRCTNFINFLDATDRHDEFDKDCFISSHHIDCEEDYNILLPEDKMEHKFVCREGEATWEIMEGSVEKAKKEFSEKFSKEIKALNDFYGKVEVKFGVITYREHVNYNYSD